MTETIKEVLRQRGCHHTAAGGSGHCAGAGKSGKYPAVRRNLRRAVPHARGSQERFWHVRLSHNVLVVLGNHIGWVGHAILRIGTDVIEIGILPVVAYEADITVRSAAASIIAVGCSVHETGDG